MNVPARQFSRALALGIVFGGVALAVRPASAQSPAIYALNSSGKLTLNATLMDDMPDAKWVSLLVVGSDRYSLRDDGLVFKNGIKLYKLGCKDTNNDNLIEGDWVGLAENSGSIWALSQLGFMAQDGQCVTQLDPGAFEFTTIFSGPTGTWSMRSDGAVFSNTTAANTFAFIAGPGADPTVGEGEAADTMWMSGTVGPDGKVYGLRRDGKILRGDVLGGSPPFAGTLLASLPAASSLTPSTLYADIAFTLDGSWNVLRGNGDVFRDPNTLTTLIELNNGDTIFSELLPLPVSASAGTTDTSFLALRKDGNLFRETASTSIGDLVGSGYGKGELAVSLEPPDLTNIKNALPVVAKYAVQAVSGTPVSFPILATDTDLAAADLVVSVDAATLPAGAVYDGVARTITWAAPVKGSYKIKVQVDDGVGNPVKLTDQVTVKDPDGNATKNIAPRVSTLKNVQGLVDIPLVFPVLASDQDGDTLTITVDDTAPPFTLGAVFDGKTNTFAWTAPALSDIGSYKIPFSVSDGTKTVKVTVTVKIVSSLLIF